MSYVTLEMTLKLPTLYLAQHSYNQIKQHGSLLLKQYAHYSRKGIEKIKTIQHNSEIYVKKIRDLKDVFHNS